MEVRTREGNEYTVNMSEIVSSVVAQTEIYLNELSNVSMEQRSAVSRVTTHGRWGK